MNDAQRTIDELGLADFDEEYELFQALHRDEMFAVACHFYQEAKTYSSHEHVTNADDRACEEQKRAVREHAQRVYGEVDA